MKNALDTRTALSRSYKVYDADKKLLLGVFEGCHNAAKFLGIPPTSVVNHANRRNNNHTNKLGLRIAIR